MSPAEMLILMSLLTVGEFKNMQKAMRVLMGVGIDQLSALEMVCPALRNKRQNQKGHRMAVAQTIHTAVKR